MKQSSSQETINRPQHTAIILDGNGRWATSRGLPRAAGHGHGAAAVRRTVEAARALGLRHLTLYAFSSDNWRRPDEEVGALMSLFRRYLAAEVPRCVETGIRLTVLGRRDRLDADLVRSIESAEEATRDGAAMRLRIAIDYSSRDTIVRAASGLSRQGASREEFAQAMARAVHDPGDTPDVDLLIRTGGEQRLSDFLLWECAYAELVFLRRMWPDFGDADFESAVADFGARERRFGGLRQAAV